MYSLFDIYGTVNLIAFAATDTSLKAATMAVCDMTGRPEVKRLLECISDELFDSKGVVKNSEVDQHELLSMWFKEALRLNSPAAGIFNRVALEDVKIKDITIRKGDIVSW